jgi:hypothetical protein
MSGQAIKVVERIWLVGNGGWGGSRKLSKSGDGNVYLVDGGSELALIDTGVGPEAGDILDNIKAAGFSSEKLTKIFLRPRRLPRVVPPPAPEAACCPH